ncbi:maleylpyruvate isomerase N-terminal domain-containing protein [Ruania halotolerans]|uniref:maleylpyruvate isomerase N-terminal domain-containing protein n=1 Tax=Ruania halotolerans TaxID=2897773 RepID=UPI001E2F838A|nr:maleylpyruvate isomerase N-terminal domain-containing protein [Ruania halotolerans]UFU08247.1 maleylpyruvate isomerase N-terminal domain-containing protein [Ruania halotolerans]
MTAPVPTSANLRTVVNDLMDAFATIPDDAWDRPAHGLDWDCRDTAAHLLDDFGAYALQLSGSTPPMNEYLRLDEGPPRREGSLPMMFWPEPDGGSLLITECVDALGGLLVAVTATAPSNRRGWHPSGLSDASGFAAMGIVEGALHGWDIMTAQNADFSIDQEIAARALNRLFPGVRRTADPWDDLLAATGRTPQTRGQYWRWDSTVRDDYGL